MAAWSARRLLLAFGVLACSASFARAQDILLPDPTLRQLSSARTAIPGRGSSLANSNCPLATCDTVRVGHSNKVARVAHKGMAGPNLARWLLSAGSAQ